MFLCHPEWEAPEQMRWPQYVNDIYVLVYFLRALRVFIFAFFARNKKFHAKAAKGSHAKLAKMSLVMERSGMKDLFGWEILRWRYY